MADYDVALKTQVPSGIQTLGNIVNIATGAQNLQRSQIELEKGKIQLQERQGIQQLFANPDAFKDATGGVDFNKLINEGMKVAPTTFPTMVPQIIQAHQASLAAQQSLNALDQQGRDMVSQFVLSQRGRDPATVKGNLDALAAHNPKLKPAVDFAWNYGLAPAAKNPEAFDQAIFQVAQRAMAAGAQVEAATPGGPVISSGQQTTQFNVKPLAGPAASPVVGVQQQLPPGTEIVEGNVKKFLGPQSSDSEWLGEEPAPGKFVGKVSDIRKDIATIKDPTERRQAERALELQLKAQRGGGESLQSSFALGQPATEEGKAQTVQTHFAEAANNVASSALLEGIAQNIKTYAQRGIVGTEQGRLEFINGILDQLGSERAADLKTATDLLKKNMAQLAKNSPAATDAARVVNQLASPHAEMNQKAINDAADQIIGQVRMSKDIYRHMLPSRLKGDNSEYLKKLGELSEFADARVWQFQALGPQEKVEMVAKMKPEDREAFKKKIKRAEEMGFFK